MTAETYDPSGFREPVASITRRRGRTFRSGLALILGLALGFLACAGLVLTCPAPRCGVLSQTVEP